MNVLQQFGSYMGSRKPFLPISLVLSGLTGLVSLLPFIFVWLIIRQLLVLPEEVAADSVFSLAWWAFGTAALAVLLYFLSLIFSHVTAFRVECSMRRSAVARLMRMPLGYFDTHTTGRIRKIIDEDSSQTHTFIAHLLPDLVGSILSPIGVLVLLFVVDWHLGLVCMIPILMAFATLAVMMNPRQQNFQREYLDAQERMSTEAVEYVRGVPVVKVFQQTVFSFKRFYDSIICYRDLVIKCTLRWRYPMSFYTAVINGIAFFLIPMAIILIHNTGNYGGVIADMILFLLITPVISGNIMKIMYLQQGMFLAGEAIKRMEALTEETPLPEPANPKSLTSYDIAFTGVTFSYPGAETPAVQDLSFTLPTGKTYALVGPSGGGKSTIARLIPRFYDVAQGSISIGGVDVREVPTHDLMDAVSFVFQNSKLFHTSLRHNVIYGTPNATEEQIRRALDLAQCREIIERLPKGVDTRIGAEGTYLSGGEQQRIILARALLKDAPIIVLDEATAFADPENEQLIRRALAELTRGKTVLLIAHRLTNVVDADAILVIDQGLLVQQGTHQALVEQEGLYRSMWEEYNRSINWTI